MIEYLMLLGTIFLIYTSILNLNSYRFKLRDIAIMIVSTLACGSVLLYISEFMAILPIIIIPAVFIYRGSKNVVRAVSIPIISVIIILLSDNIISNICISVLDIPLSQVRQDIRLYYTIIAIDFPFIFAITRFLGIAINKKFKLSMFELKGKFAILIVASLVLTGIVFYTNIIYEPNQSSDSNAMLLKGILFFAYLVLLIIIMYALIASITREMDLKNKQVQFDSLQEYTGSLEKLYTDMRSFRHDYINILSSMIGYIESNDIDRLKKYFNEKILPLGAGMESNNYKLANLKNINNMEIKGVISSKLIRAQEMNVDVLLEVAEPIEKFNFDIIDLCRVVGILLDNAIEAAIKCGRPYVKVAIIKKDNSVLLVVINSICEEVAIHRIYQKGYSTKGANRGLGLYNLKQITGKYKDVWIDTSVEDGEFRQLIEIADN
ncbi:sensor histidine kinase DpiB [Ruminiclostridium hungatei]|uniref:Sensor histidine kinase DpiB n=1 Tax=Ruminiclostridium hungatei TaxID=48256 RepID=A0A1V4SNZ1_RUMHU|nr:GHKL domain-containing protein [Ruminiclostridium hungatei]OPX45185.1 sensor histidine kinase DpiB [Ruminiclostridium hungatei]